MAVQILQSMTEHRPILLFKDIAMNLDHEVGPNTEDVSIKCGVMNLAERETIRHNGIALRVTIRKDVRGLEQFGMTKPTHRAAFPIRCQNSRSKLLLMHSSLREHRDVLASRGCGRLGHAGLCGADHATVIHLHAKDQLGWVVSNHEHWVLCVVAPRHQSHEVDERHLALHGFAKARIVPMRRIRASVFVVDRPALADGVVVRPGLSGGDSYSRDAQGHGGEYRRLENALRSDERNANALKLEALGKRFAGESVAVNRTEVVEKLEGPLPDLGVHRAWVRHRRDSYGDLRQAQGAFKDTSRFPSGFRIMATDAF